MHAKVGDRNSSILGGLFTIEVGMGMTDLYLELSVVGVQLEVFSGEPPG